MTKDKFSDKIDKEIKAFCTRYETIRSAILPVLHLIQDNFGYISDAHIELLDKDYGLNKVDVLEVITFYDIYKNTPTKKFIIRICESISCTMLGANDTIATLEKAISEMENNKGKECLFQLEKFPCLGKCDGAPVMLVNKDRHELVDSKKAQEILTQYSNSKGDAHA